MKDDIVTRIVEKVRSLSPSVDAAKLDESLRQEFGGDTCYFPRMNPADIGKWQREARRLNVSATTYYRMKKRQKAM